MSESGPIVREVPELRLADRADAFPGTAGSRDGEDNMGGRHRLLMARNTKRCLASWEVDSNDRCITSPCSYRGCARC